MREIINVSTGDRLGVRGEAASGPLMRFAYLLRSAIDRSLLRTGSATISRSTVIDKSSTIRRWVMYLPS